MTSALSILFQAVTPASALPRGLQSAAVAPAGFADAFNPKAAPTQLLGFTADTPSLFTRPIALSMDNVLILASFNLSGPIQETNTSTLNRSVTESLFEALQKQTGTFVPDFRNTAATTLETVATGLQATVLTLETEETAVTATATLSAAFPDFDQRPTETQAFGSTYAAVPTGADLTTQVSQRVGLESGDSISLADLLTDTPAGAITDVAVRLQGQGLGSPGGVLKDGGGTTVGNDIVIAYADLANYTYTAASGKSLDYLSLIGLSDPGGDSTYDERGGFQTVSLTSNGDAVERIEGTTERIQDYTFQTEDGVSFQQVTLTFDNINSLGYTNAKDAIDAGKLRVKINGLVADGEAENAAVVDLYASSGDTIVGRFVSPGATNGISVEVRSLDSAFDISTVTTRASFE